MSTVNIPIRLVLSSISESEASGSALVTPVQHRRRLSHGLPNQHPHRRRKVSAPPELLQHLGSAITHVTTTPATGATHHHDHTDRHLAPEFILSFAPGQQTHLAVPEGLYGGSDSGVTSEYSSWAAPVSGGINRGASSPDDILTSPAESVDGHLDHQREAPQDHQGQDKYYLPDSDCESDDMQSPQYPRQSVGGNAGMSNPGYVHTEPTTLVLPVSAPPTLTRNATEPVMTSPVPSNTGLVAHAHPRRNSAAATAVLQLNLQGAFPSPTAPPTTGAGARSVSMVSLNQLPQPVAHLYPNLHADTQSIYSDVHYASTSNFQAQPMGGMGFKMVEQNPIHVSPAPAGHPEAAPVQQEYLEDEEPQPTDPEEKAEFFTHTLSENLSIIYAVFLVCLGVVIYMADTFSGHDSAMAESFNVFLIVVQLLWLFYVHVDVRRYVNTISQALEEARARQTDKNEQVQLEPTGDGQYQLRINLPERPNVIPQYYGFTTGRHGGSLYLKIGATVFCFGYLIHTGLNLGQKILYLTKEDPAFENCTCTTDVVMSVLQPVYAFYQLFFIFKYSNLIINRRTVLSRFGLMHCIGASLCYWIYTILQETLQAIFMKKSYGDKGNYSSQEPLAGGAYGDDSDEVDDDDDHYYHGTKLSSESAWSINYGCEKATTLSDMINYTTPYLYPFSIEFNILMVGVWILLWENIGRIDRHTHMPSVELTYEEDNSRSFTSNLIIYVDCHASNRGLFAGLLMTVATVISIILFFILSSSEDSQVVGKYLNVISEIILLSCMLITAAIAYNSVRVLDVMKASISSVDNILLYVCLPCIFLYAFLSMVPSIGHEEFLFVAVAVLQVSQVILQTILICDGLKRCSNSSELQRSKPGREVITFLVVTNVAMWLLQTFEIKSEEGNSNMYKFYGKELWTLLSHLTLPLALFYRFHSSVCLADMWKASYEVEEEH